MAAHSEPFVRRAVLLASSHLLAAIPAPRLAGALLRTSNQPEEAWAERLHLLHAHLQKAAASDSDEVCRCAFLPLALL